MLDGEAFGLEVVEIVKGFVERATAPLLERIAALEGRPVGITADQEASIVARVLEAVPTPENGKDADPTLIRQLVDEAVAELPAPKDGEDGEGVDPSEVRKMVEEAIATLPAPQRGNDGVGLAGALIDRSGALVVTLTDGSTRDLGQVVGKDADEAAINRRICELVDAIPRPQDALGFDDIAVERQGERGFVVRFAQGERTKEFPFQLPVVLDRGVFRGERSYDEGDAVTWGGSLWIAQRETTAKPGEGEDWRLAVKKGRDGKDAKAA